MTSTPILTVNTISFGDEKALINSYSPEYVARYPTDIANQRLWWTAQYPKARVQTEILPEGEVRRLVAQARQEQTRLWPYCHVLGDRSNREAVAA